MCTVFINERPRLTFKVKVTIYIWWDMVLEKKLVMKREAEEVHF